MDLRRYDVPPKYKRLWSSCELRVVVLCSRTLQAVLIALAPHRKHSPSRRIRFILWSFYLLADSVAIFALGHLADNQSGAGPLASGRPGDKTSTITSPARAPSPRRHGGGSGFNDDLLAFWAPFLLLHLGGPDTITAFSLEDNELWLRHLLSLVVQLGGSAYVVFRSLPHNPLLVPSLVMLFTGVVKYLECTYSLQRGSTGGLRDSMLSELEQDTKGTGKEGQEPNNAAREGPSAADEESSGGTQEKLTPMDAVKHAYAFFHKFKGLVVDLVISYDERAKCRKLFLGLLPEEAYRVVEVELNFLYDLLYTKATVVHTHSGYALRAACSVALVATFFVFFFFEKKGFHPADVGITYALLGGAVALALAVLVFSDWTLEFLRARVGTITGAGHLARFVEWRRRHGERWARAVSQLSLFDFCQQEVPAEKSRCLRRRRCGVTLESIAGYFGLQDALDAFTYSRRWEVHSWPKPMDVEMKPMDPKMKPMDFIFKEVKLKSKEANNMESSKKLCASKGSHVINHHVGVKGEDDVLTRSVEVEFDETLLLWHIATDLCYHSLPSPEGHKDRGCEGDVGDNDGRPQKVPMYKALSKLLSDYMLYVLAMEPELMSPVLGIGQIRYRDTCAEAKRFFKAETPKTVEDACRKLLSVKTKVKPSEVKGDRSKSVLFDGCILARRLMTLEVKAKEDRKKPQEGAPALVGEAAGGGKPADEEERWGVVESYWAIHSKP